MPLQREIELPNLPAGTQRRKCQLDRRSLPPYP